MAQAGFRLRRAQHRWCCAGLCCFIAIAMPIPTASGAPSPAGSICSPAPETPNNGTPTARLFASLGALRHPQTATDALPPPQNAGEGLRFGGSVYANFVRRARVVAGTAYYLVPVATLQGPTCAPRDAVVLVTVEALGQGRGAPQTVRGIERGNLGGTRWIGTSGVQYGVVPDKVAEITLRYAAHKHGLRSTVTVAPVNNVYVAVVPPAARGSLLPVLPKVILWRSRKGAVLKTFHSL
jgi:hypothetical protein